ncbi:class F sortase [Microbacterium sp. kSW2-24]|uniref:class F sortase n=1 Tax=Microbacterium galbinum TaxID=2851646 RepID=UPI001FFD2A0F|nr:class F sortase [Microbacterium galbinum]MCK2021691.1 class F sortase [Microbacterium galbinum]
MRRLRTWNVLAAAGAVVLALALSACGAPGEPTEPATTPSANDGSFSAGELQDPAEPEMHAADAVPIRVQIPAIGVDTTLEDLALDSEGRLGAPVDYDMAGWYAEGVVPGAIGPAIIAGHVDSPSAPAVFVAIGDLVAGDEIVVTLSDGAALTFSVTGTAQSAKAEFPTASVYSNVPTPELRLITCGGVFDSSTGHYLDNLIVFAELRR